MKKVITAVRDKCTGYLDPVLTLTQEEAIRGFRFAVSENNSPIGFSPADFDLYELGTFDTNTGRITMNAEPEFLVNGLVAGERDDK